LKILVCNVAGAAAQRRFSRLSDPRCAYWDYRHALRHVRWSRLSEQIFRFDKWRVCRG
jgi:hypothetical protein